MAGYSGIPLVKKLGIKPGFNVAFVNAPPAFADNLDLPSEVIVNSRSRKPLDFALLFVKREKELNFQFLRYAAKLTADGMLWVAWPKKSSGVATDLTFTNVQALGLASCLLDVKICALEDVWSGLKLVLHV